MPSIHRVLVLALASVAVACAGGTGTGPASSPTTFSGPLLEPGLARVGDRTRCPVSGEEFVVAADSPLFEYGGKTYYFCCIRCEQRFEWSPGKYAAGLTERRPGPPWPPRHPCDG